MKRFIIIFSLLLLVGLLWEISHTHDSTKTANPITVSGGIDSRNPATSPSNAFETDFHETTRRSRRLVSREVDVSEWRTPINFFGKVVDDSGRAVPKASISFEWTDLSTTGSSQLQTTSDADGNFSLEGKNGKALVVRVEKEGYYTVKGYGCFLFAGDVQNFLPYPRRPVVFILKPKGLADPAHTRWWGFSSLENRRSR